LYSWYDARVTPRALHLTQIVCLVIVLGGIAAYWGYEFNRKRRRVRRRILAGRCVTCGHDLRGTAERCPECGTIPVKANT
jgi:hypothetical protein